jgi:hypothetical protein
MHGNAEKGLDDILPFQVVASSFLQIYSRGVFQENQHLLILDGHGFHVTIQGLKQVVKVGLQMVTLLAHTSHALQPLDVTCFKPFKTTFTKEGDYAMVKNNYLEPNKATLTTWVDKALQQSLKKEDIKSRFSGEVMYSL